MLLVVFVVLSWTNSGTTFRGVEDNLWINLFFLPNAVRCICGLGLDKFGNHLWDVADDFYVQGDIMH